MNVQATPAIAPDGHGGAFIAFYKADPSLLPNIFVSHVTRAGIANFQWPDCGVPTALVDGIFSSYSAGSPRIVADGSGGGIVAWISQRDGSPPTVSAQRLDPYGNRMWGPTGVIARSLSTGEARFFDQSYRAICADGSGGCFIVWEDTRNGSSNPDIFGQHILASGQIASGWDPSGMPLCTASGVQRNAEVVQDGSGGCIVSWEDARSTDLDIYASRLDSHGVVVQGWVSNGTLVCGAPQEQSSPVIADDGSHGAIIVWRDARVGASSFDIYAAHVDSSGSLDSRLGWPVGGKAICAADTVQDHPDAVSDGSGGLFVAWMDYRNNRPPGDGGPDIYAQRIDNDGGIHSGWSPDGVAVSTARLDQAFPRLASDGLGGVFVCWDDKRDAPFVFDQVTVDIYAQRLSGLGTVAAGWPVDGRAISRAPLRQFAPAITSASAGAAIVTWQDERRSSAPDNDPGDIYASLAADDSVASVAAGAPGAALSVYPNPARAGLVLVVVADGRAPRTITIVDASGRRVRVLGEGLATTGRVMQATWDLRDDGGTRVGPGLYWAVCEVGGRVEQKRIAVVN